MRRLATYCRVSTEKESQISSMENQKEFFEKFAENKNYLLQKMYADEGITGTQAKKRPQFLKMMQDAREGKFDVVATKDISRLSRNTLDFLTAIRELKQLGIEVLFVNSNLSSQDCEMLLVTMAMAAQEESRNTSARIKFSKKQNAEKGKVPNIVYGYDKIIGDYFNLKINLYEADVIRRIFRMYIDDRFGAAKIAKKLNSEGITTKRNCNWSQAGINRIITNRIYIGEIINCKEEIEDFLTGIRVKNDEKDWLITENKKMAIIDEETFYEAQAIHQENAKLAHMGQKKNCTHVFSTLLKCTDCGSYFRRQVRNKKYTTDIKWVCCGRNQNGADSCSDDVVIDESELLENIKKYFLNMVENESGLIKSIVDDFNKCYKPVNENLKTEKALSKEIAAIKKKKEKYLEMYSMDAITKDELKEYTDEFNSKLAILEDKLKMIKYNITQGDKLSDTLKNTFETIYDITNSAEITNEMLKRVIDRIEVKPDGNVDIYLKLYKDIGLSEKYQYSDNRT